MAEDTSQNSSQKTSHTVNAKRVEAVVVAKSPLQGHCAVANDSRQDADGYAAGNIDVTGCRRNRDQTGNNTRGETQGCRLALVQQFNQHPAQARCSSGCLRGRESRGGQGARSASTASVETKPAKP